MTEKRVVWRLVPVALLAAAFGLTVAGGLLASVAASAAGTAVACRPSESLLLVQQLGALSSAAAFHDDLIVMDSCGTELRRITVPQPAFVRPTARAAQAIVHTGWPYHSNPTGPTFLVDAATGSSLRLAIPEMDPSVAWGSSSELMTMGSMRWMLVGHTDTDPLVYLVDLETGAATDLLAALPAFDGDIGEIELVALLPGDEYVYLDAWNGPFIISTADPSQTYRLGEPDEVENASLSPDGRRIVYTLNTEAGNEEALVTEFDSEAAPEIVASIASTKSANELFARYLPDGAILFESPNRAWILDPETMTEQELPTGDAGGCGPIGNWIPSARGDTIVYSLENGGCGVATPTPSRWLYFDRVTGQGHAIPELDGHRLVESFPLAGTGLPGVLPSAWHTTFDRGSSRWRLLAPPGEGGVRVADYRTLRRLDLESGEVDEIGGLPEGNGFALTVSNPGADGSLFVLLYDFIEATGAAYLLDNQQSVVEPLGGILAGAFSPDGAWLALGDYPQDFEVGLVVPPRLTMIRVADGTTFDLGAGVATWLTP